MGLCLRENKAYSPFLVLVGLGWGLSIMSASASSASGEWSWSESSVLEMDDLFQNSNSKLQCLRDVEPSSNDMDITTEKVPTIFTAVCGNGVIEGNESCDPGMNVIDDCCTKKCGEFTHDEFSFEQVLKFKSWTKLF